MEAPMRPARRSGIPAPAHLSEDAQRVLEACDGAREVAAIAAGSGLDEVRVFAALDALADAGLLEQRIAPPAGLGTLSRRALVSRAAQVAAAAAGVLAGGARAGTPEGLESAQGEQEAKRQKLRGTQGQEQQRKRQGEQEVKRADQAAGRATEQQKKNTPGLAGTKTPAQERREAHAAEQSNKKQLQAREQEGKQKEAAQRAAEQASKKQ
jgi:hypothetical protein